MVSDEERILKRKKMQAAFLGKLDGRMREIRELAETIRSSEASQEQLELFHRLVHNLNGSSGTYGLISISQAAEKLERLISVGQRHTVEGLPWADIDARISTLDGLVAMAKTLDPDSLLAPVMPVKNASAPLVHIVEDDPEQAAHLRACLQREGFRTELFESPSGFKARLNEPDREPPAAVLVDLVYPDDPEGGIKLMAELELTRERNIPVIVISVRDDLPSRLAAYRAGATRYIAKPVDIDRLLSSLNALTSRQPEIPFRVMLVDDDETMLEAEAHVLREAGMQVMALGDPLETLESLDAFAPDVIVLDVYMPKASGPELAAIIREREKFLQTSILFLSSERDLTQQLRALSLGGDDFLVKPIDPKHFIAAVDARARRTRQAQRTQHRLELTLYEREREHRALNRHAIVSVTDAEGTIIDVNDKLCEVSGYSREELIGNNHSMLKSGHHSPRFFGGLWKTIIAGRTWHGEICNRRKDGELYWVLSTITPFLDNDGKPYQYVSIRTEITQNKKAQLELDSIRATLEGTLEATDEGIMATDEEGKVRFANQRFYDMWRIPPDLRNSSDLEDVLMDLVEEQLLKPEGFRERVRELAVSGDETSQDELKFRDGRIYHRYSRGMKLRGKFSGRVWSFRDVTENIQIQAALTRANELLERTNSAARIGTWELSVDTLGVVWSSMTREIHEVSGDFLPDFHNTMQFFKEGWSRDLLEERVRTCIHSQRMFDEELILVTGKDNERWVRAVGVPEVIDGETYQIHGIFQDIDERKRNQISIVASEKALQEAQALAHIGSWQLEWKTGKLKWSDQMYRIFGVDPTTFTPTPDSVLSFVHPEDHSKLVTQSEWLDPTGKDSLESRYRVVRPNGEIRHIHQLGELERDWDGTPLRMGGTAQDVTEEVAARESLIRAREEADRANRAKSEFLSSMSHELRTPMNAIIGFSQLLELDSSLSPDQKESATEIRRAGDHLLGLINEVLDLAKVESGKMDLSLEPVEVASVVDECLTLTGSMAAKRDIRLSAVDLSGASMLADRIRLKQVLLNLLSNAVKYNRPEGSARIEFEVLPDGMARLGVRDTGPGVAREKLEQLFEPFNRLDAEQTDIEGTGIGLSLARQLTELMGGHLDVESEPGVGSVFWIVLPSAASEAPDVAEGTAADAAVTSALPTERFRVLYIEDNPANLKLVSRLCGRRADVDLLTAHEPRLGIELAQSRLPDLILLDINLPGMDGYEVLDVLSSHASTRRIPVLAVTAQAMAHDIERGRKAGFVEYLTKPIDVHQFNAALDRWLHREADI